MAPADVADALSAREREVLVLLAAGLTTDEVAEVLVLSRATVKNHVHRILTRTGFDRRERLVAHWLGVALPDRDPDVTGSTSCATERSRGTLGGL